MEQGTQNTALLIMDIQPAILSNLADASTVLSNEAKAIAHARQNKIPVIYVTVGFRNGAPEVSMNNKSFGAGKERFAKMDMDDFLKIHPDVAPQPGEIVVTKRRVSAFTGSDIEVVLRAMNVRHLVLTGVSTSGCVLSTLREAADKDFALTVIADCCADPDDEVHRVLTTKVFVRQADVVTIDEWTKK